MTRARIFQRRGRRAGARTGVLLGVLLAGAAGCGVVGDPIAPEDVGIAEKVRERRQAETAHDAPRAQPGTPGEPDTTLPPLQPVGVQ